MDHLALDLGGRESQLCVRAPDGTILEERRVSTRKVKSLFERPPARVIVETCAEAFAIADLALASGHQVRVVPAGLARRLGVGAHGVKNDQRDARALSEASCRIDLPSVHVPSHWSRQTKAMCGVRDRLVQSRTAMVNAVRGWLRTQLKGFKGGAVKHLPQRVRNKLQEQLGAVPDFLERMLATIEFLTLQIEAATSELAQLAEENEVCRRLMTVPGVGPITSLRFVAAVDEVGRFSDAHQLESYLGLTPGEESSSEHKRITGITKAGSSTARWTLIQAAWATLRRRGSPSPLRWWAMQLAERRGKNITVVAVARKLAGILFALWRDGTTYAPDRAAESRMST
jgi:transposase